MDNKLQKLTGLRFVPDIYEPIEYLEGLIHIVTSSATSSPIRAGEFASSKPCFRTHLTAPIYASNRCTLEFLFREIVFLVSFTTAPERHLFQYVQIVVDTSALLMALPQKTAHSYTLPSDTPALITELSLTMRRGCGPS